MRKKRMHLKGDLLLKATLPNHTGRGGMDVGTENKRKRVKEEGNPHRNLSGEKSTYSSAHSREKNFNTL